MSKERVGYRPVTAITEYNPFIDQESISPSAKDLLQLPEHEGGKKKESDFGAFFQVLQKRGNNISYITYGLPRNVSAGMLECMMTGVLYPEPYFQGDVNSAKFADGDLQILARPGLHIDAVDRMLSLPKEVFADSEEIDLESKSMLRYSDRYQKMQSELPAIKEQFLQSLVEESKAKVADGFHIYHGAYEYRNGDVVGLNLEGTREFSLLQIAKDDEHQQQMEALVEVLGTYDTVTVVLVDKSKTVSECWGSCSDYFEMKEREGGIRDLSELDAICDYAVVVAAPNLIGAKIAMELTTLCGDCEMPKADCSCARKSVLQ